MSLQPPEHLDDRAREEWYRVLPALQRTGFFDSDLDEVILAGYCSMVSHAIAAERLLAERGLVYVGPDGTEKADPIAECVVDLSNAVLNAAIVLGLTPKSRAAIESSIDNWRSS